METIQHDYTSKKWNNLKRILETPGPFCHSGFEASPKNLEFLMTECKILVIGI